MLKIKHLDVFLIFLLVRLASVFLIQTYFVPDEYYQSIEVAHRITFGYGHLTWEWFAGIRSYIHPLIFAAFYKGLKMVKLDSAEAVIYGPRILQAILTAYSDLCFYKWSGTKKWAVFTIASSWFLFYTGSRTLINTFEGALTTITLSKFPWVGRGIDDNSLFIWTVILLAAIRPTSVLVWAPICLYHLSISKQSIVRLVVSRYLPIGLIVLTVTTLIDSVTHGSFVVTPYNFLNINVFNNIASSYGEHPWHWYLSQGIPAVLGIHILPFTLAVVVVLKQRHVHPNELAMLGAVIFSIFTLSFIKHKEFRFLSPLLPIMFYISSRFLSAWSRKASVFSVWLVSTIIFLGNLAPAFYLGYVHQRGTLDVMESLRDIALKDPANTNFVFLMPCHSTPLYSHLHVNVSTNFLTCNPNLNKIEGYVDQTELFYKNPNAWLRQSYPPRRPLPSHIICFDSLVSTIGGDILTRYKRIAQIYHCDWPLTSKLGKFVVVYERQDYKTNGTEESDQVL